MKYIKTFEKYEPYLGIKKGDVVVFNDEGRSKLNEEHYTNVKYSKGDYILMSTKDIVDKELLNSPYAKIIEVIPQGKYTVFKLEVILDNKVITNMFIFSEDAIRNLDDKEIKKFKKKCEMYNNLNKFNL